MARIDVGEIDEQLLEWFARRAQRLGQSQEDFARSMIEREARSEQAWQTLEQSSNLMRQRLKSIGRYETPAQIAKHRDQ